MGVVSSAPVSTPHSGRSCLPRTCGPLWRLVMYVLFVGLNLVGVETSFRFTVAITLLALAILLVFYVGALRHFS